MPDQIETTVSSIPEPKKEEKTEIDWKSAQVPEDIIKSHPLYKSLLEESIERRKKIADLNQLLKEPKEEKIEKPVEGQALTAEKVQELMKAEFSRLETLSRQNTLLERYKVPETDRDLWRDGDIAAMEKRLQAAFGKINDGSSPGNGGDAPDRFAELRQRIKDNLSGEAPKGPGLFSPERQRALGGGIIKPS